MKAIKTLAVMVGLLALTSCGTVQHGRSMAFDSVRLELGMDNLQYLGESVISVDYTSYLGLIKTIDKVNGEMYDPGNPKSLTMPRSCRFRNQTLDLAAYQLVEKYPTADYFQIVYEGKTRDRLFLGSINHEYARVKAYKLK